MIFLLIPPLFLTLLKLTLSHEMNTQDTQKVRMLGSTEITDWSWDCL